MTTLQAMTSTGNDGWRTPPALLDALDAEFRFHLDAAASHGHEAFPGRAYIPPEHDSLSVRWLDYMPRFFAPDRPPAAFLNSPYSKKAGAGEGILAWHRKAWQEARTGITVVCLHPPTLARGWNHQFGQRADEHRIFKHRLAFVHPVTGEPVKGNTQDSMLTVYRPHVPEGGWREGPRTSYIECRG